MRVRTYTEAVRLANCAGEDAANRRMRKAGRKAWSASDHDHAASVTQRMLVDLGFDVTGWAITAGQPRNEPESPSPRRKPSRRKQGAPVQLSFGF